jgi:peptidoglycan L-alanyl-D-glutamate endopeptidase CwlK
MVNKWDKHRQRESYHRDWLLRKFREKQMAFKLSQRSFQRLVGVHPKLDQVVRKAIEYTDVDFGVIFGVRDLATQERLYKSGKSQTMASKHLIQDDGYAHAVDLMAYDSGEPSWDIVDYDNIADAMRKAAQEIGVDLIWGAAWHKLLTVSPDTAENLMNEYIDLRRSEGRRPFIDGPHFQLAT